MKKLSILLVSALLALVSCTKSKIVHPEIGNGNDEIITVGVDNVQIKYIRNDVASLQKVMFNYSLANEQQFTAAEMTKHSDCFTLTLNNLLSDTLYSYYYELFPYNANAYQTDQKTFRTLVSVPTPPPVVVPTGAINGLFTINEHGDKVYFSQGNLQYQASTNTWRFAEHQWDCIGIDNENASSTYDGRIDLFGWGTSGYNHGAICYQPWSTDITGHNYNPYGSLVQCLYENSGLADWGRNSIVNGGNMQNQWRTLALSQWHYLLFDRNTASNIRFAFAIVNNVKGVIIVPDDWDNSQFNLNANNDQVNFNNNIFSETQWTDLEQNGAVFLPTGGYRYGISVMGLGIYGYYWSSSVDSYGIGKVCMDQYFNTTHGNRFEGQSVRLIHDAGMTPVIVVNLPTVSTKEVSDITSNSAMCGGRVTADGGAVVTEYGLCWNINGNPTVNDNHLSAAGGVENYTAYVEGLTANTTYHIRAYATNSAGTSYGDDIVFRTLSNGGSNAPEGAINGLFTINDNGDQVYFSQGNLQYQASTNTWRFAENQWDYVGTQNPNFGDAGGNVYGSDNLYISDTYNGWIDLFGWGTSGYNHGAVCYQPWSTSSTSSDYYAYGQDTYNLNQQTGRADWGYNAISNGGNQENIGWRTLMRAEYDYLLNWRNTPSGIRWALGTVNGVHGIIILPDDWVENIYLINNTNNNANGVSFDSNIISAEDWVNVLEANNAVFLPAAGQREWGTLINNINAGGHYWSSSSCDTICSYSLLLHDPGINWASNYYRSAGYSVRLVQDYNNK